MSKVLIIGCGGVASVAIHKCCQVPEVFTDICIASRTKSKCDKLAAELAPTTTTNLTTAQVDADHVDEVIALIKSYQPDLVMNIALPYQDLTIMDACLAGDVVGDYSFDAPLAEGDRLIFGDMAIYTTCKNNTFNGMPLPPIWALAEDGTCRELVRFGYNDFKMRLGHRA